MEEQWLVHVHTGMYGYQVFNYSGPRLIEIVDTPLYKLQVSLSQCVCPDMSYHNLDIVQLMDATVVNP